MLIFLGMVHHPSLPPIHFSSPELNRYILLYKNYLGADRLYTKDLQGLPVFLAGIPRAWKQMESKGERQRRTEYKMIINMSIFLQDSEFIILTSCVVLKVYGILQKIDDEQVEDQHNEERFLMNL